jgi:hypothetical protein
MRICRRTQKVQYSRVSVGAGVRLNLNRNDHLVTFGVNELYASVINEK